MNSMNFGEPSGGGFIDTHFDFKTCQRSNGTFYGTAGDCSQKGSREVKNEKKAVDKRADAIVKDAGKSASGTRAFYGAVQGFLPAVGPAISAMLEAKDLYDAATDKDGKKRAKAELEVAKKAAVAAIKKAKADDNKAKPAAPTPAEKPKAKPKAEKPKVKSKRTIKVTRPNTTRSEMLAEWRNTFKYQRDRGEPKANARRNATLDLLNEGYDIRKLHRTPSNPDGVFTDMGVDMNNLVFK
jgi:hypothetical protein